ncbi:MAG: YebC/PmpR family DNA-binding transcriptional regulator [Candidatus Andersenbacteria bacterium]|nr:YebC/PmpR family DNA-binding transcriptional regulator [Candidatus Andersenbacteria bacterium]MBI3250772.1 YebC/PmpR family DNA-binding transcriptional regulator [Candidatus Andersenbacteria bacterium]
MSGHSKWHNIKIRKEATDAKKGKAFTKLAKEIISAVKQGGADPAANALLRDVIARAKKVNMPQANISRLLQDKDSSNLQTIVYEAFGPGGSALLIEATTDNPNRTVGQVRTILRDNNGSLGGPNSVHWKFNDGGKPQYPLELSDSDNQALQTLMTALEAEDDVTSVTSDATSI